MLKLCTGFLRNWSINIFNEMQLTKIWMLKCNQWRNINKEKSNEYACFLNALAQGQQIPLAELCHNWNTKHKTFNLALLINKFSEIETQKDHTCTKKEGITNGYIDSYFLQRTKSINVSSVIYIMFPLKKKNVYIVNNFSKNMGKCLCTTNS